jgi:hypothetical protein
MTEKSESNGNLDNLTFLLASLSDNGRSLRAFVSNPQELAITIITAGLLSNSKLMISPEDAVKSAFDIHSRIQRHVANYQSIQFAANIENCFSERPPEVEGD